MWDDDESPNSLHLDTKLGSASLSFFCQSGIDLTCALSSESTLKHKGAESRAFSPSGFQQNSWFFRKVIDKAFEKDWLFLSISKFPGWLKVRLHRPLPDGFTLKNILLTRKADGWYVSREHQRIARSRLDHSFKTAHRLVRTGKKVFFAEDLNLRGLTKRNKAKKDEQGKFVPNGQSAKSGLNKSWLDAGFGQFFTTLDYIASKAGAVVVKVNPAYTSQLLSYRDEFVFINCDVRSYFDPKELLVVDRDVNASINIKRQGLGLFPCIKSRRGKVEIVSTATASSPPHKF